MDLTVLRIPMWNAVFTKKAQLLHATLRVFENAAAKLLKIMQNYTAEYGVCELLLVYYWNHVSILYRF